MLIESPQAPTRLLAWLAPEAPEAAVQVLAAPDGPFRGVLCARPMPSTPDAAARAVQQVLSSSPRGALVKLSAFDKEGGARLAAATCVRLPPESSTRGGWIASCNGPPTLFTAAGPDRAAGAATRRPGA